MADRDSSIMLEDELKRGFTELGKYKPGSKEYTLGAKSMSELYKCKTDGFKVNADYSNDGIKLAQDKELKEKELDIDRALRIKELNQDKKLRAEELDIEAKKVDVMEKEVDNNAAWWRQVDWGRLACGGLFFLGGLATMKFEATGYILKIGDYFKAIPKQGMGWFPLLGGLNYEASYYICSRKDKEWKFIVY